MRSTSMNIAMVMAVLIVWIVVIGMKTATWRECRLDHSRIYCLTLIGR